MAKKYYAVRVGKKPGIYEKWDDCRQNVHGYPAAEFKSFPTLEEAKAYMAEGQFEEGTMLPKIDAAIAYLEKVPEGSVLITSLNQVKDAVKGKTGTRITAV